MSFISSYRPYDYKSSIIFPFDRSTYLVTVLYILIAVLMILEKTYYTFDWPIKTIYSLIVPINWSSILVIALQIINTGIMIIITAK